MKTIIEWIPSDKEKPTVFAEVVFFRFGNLSSRLLWGEGFWNGVTWKDKVRDERILEGAVKYWAYIPDMDGFL
jgi:hypothetical protein